MAPIPVTEDYYLVLEVDQTATLEQITKAYKRLALRLHPDRNASAGATRAFQVLGAAYETLKDTSKRRDYDILYPSVRKTQQSAQAPRPDGASNSRPEPLSEAAQILELQKKKRERNERWAGTRKTFDTFISELQQKVDRLERVIRNLNNLAAAEAAVEADQHIPWTTEPRKHQENEEEEDRKSRLKQERRIEVDLKERILQGHKSRLGEEKDKLVQAQKLVDDADAENERKIAGLQAKIWERERREREEKQKEERAAKEAEEARLRKEREAREAKEKEEKLRQEKKDYEEEMERRREWDRAHSSSTRKTCGHGGWWKEIAGRKDCERCGESWRFLLECPGCCMMACPKCKRDLQPGI